MGTGPREGLGLLDRRVIRASEHVIFALCALPVSAEGEESVGEVIYGNLS